MCGLTTTLGSVQERVARLGGLGVQDVEPRAGEVARGQALGQVGLDDQAPARRVDQDTSPGRIRARVSRLIRPRVCRVRAAGAG